MKKYFIAVYFILSSIVILTAQDALTITENGNVGVNNSTPEYTMDIDGDLYVSGKIFGGNIIDFKQVTVNETYPLPEVSGYKGIITIIWECTSGSILSFSNTDNAFINGDLVSLWKGEGEGKIVLASFQVDNVWGWRVIDYTDTGFANDIYWKKYANGTVEMSGATGLPAGSVGTMTIAFPFSLAAGGYIITAGMHYNYHSYGDLTFSGMGVDSFQIFHNQRNVITWHLTKGFWK